MIFELHKFRGEGTNERRKVFCFPTQKTRNASLFCILNRNLFLEFNFHFLNCNIFLSVNSGIDKLKKIMRMVYGNINIKNFTHKEIFQLDDRLL